MDGSKEIETDVEEALDNDSVPVLNSHPTNSEEEQCDHSENAKSQPQGPDDKCLEIPIDNQDSIEHVAIEKAAENEDTDMGTDSHDIDSVDTSIKVDADISGAADMIDDDNNMIDNDNSNGDTNMKDYDNSHGGLNTMDDGNAYDDTIMKVDGDISGEATMKADGGVCGVRGYNGGDATMKGDGDVCGVRGNTGVDATMNNDGGVCGVGGDTGRDALGNTCIIISGSDANLIVDSNKEVSVEADAHDTSANAKLDTNAETSADLDTDGCAKVAVDGRTYLDANNYDNADTDGDSDATGQHDSSTSDDSSLGPSSQLESEALHRETNSKDNKLGQEVKKEVNEMTPDKEFKGVSKQDSDEDADALKQSFPWEPRPDEGSESGSEEDQSAFMKELEIFFRERGMDFKPPKFYGEPLNCLKLWRAVIRLGGHEQVTSCKLWRQVGESFKPPKTCTTVSWTFRSFYEKALLEYEKHKLRGGELSPPAASFEEPESIRNQVSVNVTSGRARRDAAARAMQGWHSQRLLSNGEVGDPIIKDKNSSSIQKREKQLKNIGFLKRKKPSGGDRVKVARMKVTKPQVGTMVVDNGPPADWVKVNVQRTRDCFEVYALVPGLLREEVRVQSDPAGRLVISGEPEQLDNPWGVTPFKKVVSLPSRIDPHQTSAVVTLHGQLFVRVPFEQPDS